jgi:hypothetical protein
MYNSVRLNQYRFSGYARSTLVSKVIFVGRQLNNLLINEGSVKNKIIGLSAQHGEMFSEFKTLFCHQPKANEQKSD